MEGHPKALLPAGLHDLLPPDAAKEACAVGELVEVFAAHGYELVKPPLVEFEEGLVGGDGESAPASTFRLMDPVSQRMVGVRADMTPQVARIATTRLHNAARPLRLCYAGEVLRVKGSHSRPARQFCQVGVELIGAAQAAAGDAEVVLLAAEALARIGIEPLFIDLNLPTLVPRLCDELGLEKTRAARLRAALDRKDQAAVAAVEASGRNGKHSPGVFGALLAAAGPAEQAIEALAALSLPEISAQEAARLAEVVTLILEAKAGPDIRLTVDPVENRGFEYHAGVSFSIFSERWRAELGSGGRYLAGATPSEGGGEPATGFTLFMDTVMRVVPDLEAQRRLFVPPGVPRAQSDQLRAKGWITLQGLTPAEDVLAEARRLRCTHAYVDGDIVAVG